jgi:NAD(P)-dependent dehydrogenase (short-subunit alcohol dehydrogenase family)
MPPSLTPAELLRPGLLEGVAVLIAGPPSAPPAGRAPAIEMGEVLAGLGASVSSCSAASDLSDADQEAALDAAVMAALAQMGRVDLLAVDGAGLFAHGLARAANGHAALRACMDSAWNATRATVNHAFLAPAVRDGQGAEDSGDEPVAVRGGRVVYLAPAPDAGAHADAARAGLENLARTLSIEWARHRITTVAIALGARTAGNELAALVAYLASPAGAYFSGCQLDLRGIHPAA